MAGKPVRVVVDTNLWVSMVMGSKTVSHQMAQLLSYPDIALFVSAELVEELTLTLAKPKLQRYLTFARTKSVFDLIGQAGQPVNVMTSVKLCRDPKDDFIINLALDANANYLITGDADLLELNAVGPVDIVTISEFVTEVCGSG